MFSFDSVLDTDFDAMADLRAQALRDSLEHLGRYDPVRVRERLRSAFVPVHAQSAGGQRCHLTDPHASAAQMRLHHSTRSAPSPDRAQAHGLDCQAQSRRRARVLCGIARQRGPTASICAMVLLVEEQEFV